MQVFFICVRIFMSIVVFERNKSMIAPPVINGVTKMRTGAKMS